MTLAKQIFELDASGSLFVTVFDDDRAVEMDPAFEGLSSADDRLRAGHDYSTFGDDHSAVLISLDKLAFRSIEKRRG